MMVVMMNDTAHYTSLDVWLRLWWWMILRIIPVWMCCDGCDDEWYRTLYQSGCVVMAVMMNDTAHYTSLDVWWWLRWWMILHIIPIWVCGDGCDDEWYRTLYQSGCVVMAVMMNDTAHYTSLDVWWWLWWWMIPHIIPVWMCGDGCDDEWYRTLHQSGYVVMAVIMNDARCYISLAAWRWLWWWMIYHIIPVELQGTELWRLWCWMITHLIPLCQFSCV